MQQTVCKRENASWIKNFGVIVADESLPYDAKVMTERGNIKIGDIVELDLTFVKVLSYNLSKKIFEFKPITKTWKHFPSSPMMKITHEQGSFKCTANHLVLTMNGYVEAKNLLQNIDCVIYYNNEKTRHNRTNGFDNRIKHGRWLYINKSVKQSCKIQSKPFRKTKNSCLCKIRHNKNMVSFPSKKSSKSRIRKLEMVFCYNGNDIIKRDKRKNVSKREKRNKFEVVRNILVCKDVCLVGNGRRKLLQTKNNYPHRRFRPKRCHRTSTMDGRKVWKTSNNSKSKNWSCSDIQYYSVKRSCNIYKTTHNSKHEIQNRSHFTKTTRKNMHTLRESDSVHRLLSTLSKQKILRFGTMSTGNENSRRYVVQKQGNGSTRNIQTFPFSSKIIKVEQVNTPKIVYDLSIKEHHNFIIDNVLVHNCHHWAAKTFLHVANMFPAAYRIGVSASEKRKDGLEFLIYDSFGPCVYEIHKEYLVELGKLLPIKMEVIRTDYMDESYVESCMAREPPDWINMISELAVDRERNDLIFEHINRVLLANKRHRILMLSERVQACKDWVEKLKSIGIPAGLMIGGSKNSRKLEETIDGLRDGSVRIGVGTKVADEGLDIPPLTHIFLTCPVHQHPKRLTQMVGRAARISKGKKEAVAVYFWDWRMFPWLRDENLQKRRDRENTFLKNTLRKACNKLDIIE